MADKSAGRLIGAATGEAVTAGTIVAGTQSGLPGVALAAGITVLTGAALGPVVLPKVRQAAAEDAKWGDQWWTRKWSD